MRSSRRHRVGGGVGLGVQDRDPGLQVLVVDHHAHLPGVESLGNELGVVLECHRDRVRRDVFDELGALVEADVRGSTDGLERQPRTFVDAADVLLVRLGINRNVTEIGGVNVVQQNRTVLARVVRVLRVLDRDGLVVALLVPLVTQGACNSETGSEERDHQNEDEEGSTATALGITVVATAVATAVLGAASLVGT